MSILDLYCTDINSLLNNISGEIINVKQCSANEKQKIISKIQQLDTELTDMLKQFELEARSSDDSNLRKAMNERIKGYKNQQSSLRSEMDGLKFQSQKDSLTGRSSEEVKSKAANQQATLDRQNDMILRAQRLVQETEDLAVNEIIPTLGDNKERILSAQEKTTEFHGVVDSAKKITDSMTRRHKTWGFF